MSFDVEKIADFVYANGGDYYRMYSRELLKDYITRHIMYGTFLQVSDSKGISAVARWNMKGLTTAHVLDVVIRKDVRGIKALKSLLYIGSRHRPGVKFIMFDRDARKNRKPNEYTVGQILRRRS